MMGLWQSSNCNSVQRLYSAFIITGAPFTTVREHRLLSAQVKGLEKILATIVYVCVSLCVNVVCLLCVQQEVVRPYPVYPVNV